MKTIANCNPIEFLKQTNKIRKLAADFLRDTKILEARRVQPVLDGDESPEEKRAKTAAQAKQNLSCMLDIALEEHAAQTAELLAAMCFIEPAEIDKYRGVDFMLPALELLQSPEVQGFFISLMELGQRTIKD